MAALRPALPDKLYFKIGEVAELVGVKPYVLRYWESEFNILKPSKSVSRQRLYRQQDVHTLLRIKHLLHEERFTIEGARKQLKTLQREDGEQAELPLGDRAYRSLLMQVKREIEAIRAILS